MALKRSFKEEKEYSSEKKILLEDEKKLNDFTQWLKIEGFNLNRKVHITKKDVSSGWGMVATEDIKQDEILFKIPRKAILCPENSSLKQHIENSGKDLESKSGWVKLLLVLLSEYSNESSYWSPYFSMVPSFQHLHLPMFWNKEELEKELCGTNLASKVASDIDEINQEFHKIVLPFISKHPSFFKKDVTLDEFMKMVAFVMAYSFTEPVEIEDDEDEVEKNPPMMVPLADVLNHVSNHNACLKFSSPELQMIAVCDIQAGEEIYNTYGPLSNEELLHMYGYTEHPDLTVNDNVNINMGILVDVMREEAVKSNNMDLLERKLQLLDNMDVSKEEDCIVLGKSNVIEGQEIIKILTMDKINFEKYFENDGWESEDEDEENYNDYESLHKLPSNQKTLLKNFVERHIKSYPHSIEDEEALLAKLITSGKRNEKSSCIKLFSSFLRTGHLRICRNFLMALIK